MGKLWMVLVLLCVSLSPVVPAGLRVLGMIVKEMRTHDQQVYGYKTLFGDGSRTLQSDEQLLLWGGGHKCWNGERRREAFCYFYLKVTQTENRQHYDILGGLHRKYDRTTTSILNTTTWGFTNEGTLVDAGHGYVITGRGGWGHHYSWGYGYSYFYVNQTMEPPMTKAFAYQLWHDSAYKVKPEVVTPASTDVRDASHVFLESFDSYSHAFKGHTMLARWIYRTPTTLVDFTAHMDDKETIDSNEDTPNEIIKERTIENNGCGSTHVVGSTGQLQASLEISMTESMSFTTSWSFGFAVSYTAEFGIGVVSNSLEISSEFSFSSEESFETSHTTTSKETYQWPYVCDPGYKCTTTLLVTKKLYKIPCTMTFEREDERFTRTTEMLARVETFHEINKSPVPLDRTHC